MLRHLVEDQTEDRRSHPLQPFQGVEQVLVGDPSRMGHDEHAVDGAGERDRIRHRQDRGRIHDDVVVVPAHLGEQLLNSTPAEQLARIRRHRPGGVEADLVLGADGHVPDDITSNFAEEQVGEPGRLGLSEHLVQPGSAEIGVDEGHPMTGLRQHDSEVRRGGGLALSCQRAGDLNDLDRTVEPEEHQVGAQPPIGLDGVVGRFADGDRATVRGRVDRHHGQHRPVGQLFEVLLRADLVVEVVEQECRTEPEQEPDDRRRA